MPTKLRDVIRADLLANTGQRKLRRAVDAFLFRPGFATMLLHRLALPLIRTPFDKLGMLIWAWNTRRSGCHLHLDSEIAPGLCLPHPVAVVIGQGVKVGANATIYQSVTIGKSKADSYPVIGPNVTIFPNAVIIGPITIGAGAVVGAGSVVLKDVPAGAVVAGNPARVLKSPQTITPVSSVAPAA
jgi:serine O-acetyltransferase